MSIHPNIAAALAPFAPPASQVHQAARRWPADFTDSELCAADLAVKVHKESGAELQVAIAREVKAINDAGGNSHA